MVVLLCKFVVLRINLQVLLEVVLFLSIWIIIIRAKWCSFSRLDFHEMAMSSVILVK
jgi:hypothetical protein